MPLAVSQGSIIMISVSYREFEAFLVGLGGTRALAFPGLFEDDIPK